MPVKTDSCRETDSKYFKESFNENSQNECLDEHAFHLLAHATENIKQWRKNYSEFNTRL